jgi:hypothetical protein
MCLAVQFGVGGVVHDALYSAPELALVESRVLHSWNLGMQKPTDFNHRTSSITRNDNQSRTR